LNANFPERGQFRPWILGHRGTRRDAPENTLLAFEHAMAGGADGIELDVRLARDEEVVVCHDRDLARVTEGRDHRAISEVDSNVLRQVDLGRDQGIPTLREVLVWATAAGAMLNVELKTDGENLLTLARAIARLNRAHAVEGAPRVLYSSFHLGALLWLIALRVNGLFALLIPPGKGRLARLPVYRMLGLNGVHPAGELLDPTSVQRWHSQGLFVGTWTINDDATLRRASESGADIIITDEPELARRTLT